ncbi:MAG: electron transport complex subunit RsxC [Halanaerobiales bacterium]
MEAKTFDSGMYIPHYKEYTKDKPIEELGLPDRVVIPLLQHLGETCDPVVEVGDYIVPGQKIGDHGEYWSAPIHSGVAGEVVAIEDRPHPKKDKVKAVIIEVDHDGPRDFEVEEVRDPDLMTEEEMKEAIRKAGAIGMGGGACPTYINIDIDESVDCLILNGAECEPFLTCDHRVMVERADDLIGGAEVLMKIIGANHCHIGIEINKPDAIEILQEKLEGRDDIKVEPLDDKYPQGYKKNIIKSITGKEPPPGARSAEVGCIVKNVSTAVAAYEAVVYGKGCYERVVTVSGPDTVPEPGNYLIKIGTTVREVLTRCGVDTSELDGYKVIMGGAMTGNTQTTLDVPVTKSTTGILLLPPDMVVNHEEYMPCIRCGKCARYCPMFLYPGRLSNFAERGQYDLAEEWKVDLCAECGICSFVCPSQRPVVHMLMEAKAEIKKRRK